MNPLDHADTLTNRPVAAPARPATKTTGLCATCVNAANCIFSHEGYGPILQCEEFEGFAPMDIEEVRHRQQIFDEPQEQSVAEVPAEPQYKGLCVNCEKRATCSLKAVEGGVWQCEEYE